MKNSVFLFGLFAGVIALSTARAEETTRRQTYDDFAKANLLRAHEQMARATEVTIYLLDPDKTVSAKAKDRPGFPIRPYSIDVAVKGERTVRGDDLTKLLGAWMELANQDGYANAMCHYPVYGLRFRDAAGAVCFETSLCWGCSNYFIEEGGDYQWAALPKKHLPDSVLKKLLDQLFEAARGWPGINYTEVRGYAYNFNGGPASIISAEGKLNESVINPEGALLSQAQTNRLIEALTGTHPDHPIASCFNPRHAFVFYDQARQPAAVVNICFECLGAQASPTGTKLPYDLPALADLCAELKLEGAPAADFRAWFDGFRTGVSTTTEAPHRGRRISRGHR